MIKLRIDVDYPYTSRTKSFLYVALGIKSTKGKDYLKNACIIAMMINESQKNVKAYWFFTPYTVPDKRLLDLLSPEKHIVALHVANKPFEEWKTLENKTNRKVQYYTIHGTQRLLARLLWGRKFSQTQAEIPSEFSLVSFHDAPNITMSLDRERFLRGYEKVLRQTREWIAQGIVMSMHPEWLFETAEKTQRGPFYDALKTMLEVDSDLDTISIRRALSVRIARDFREYYKTHQPDQGLSFQASS